MASPATTSGSPTSRRPPSWRRANGWPHSRKQAGQLRRGRAQRGPTADTRLRTPHGGEHGGRGDGAARRVHHLRHVRRPGRRRAEPAAQARARHQGTPGRLRGSPPRACPRCSPPWPSDIGTAPRRAAPPCGGSSSRPWPRSNCSPRTRPPAAWHSRATTTRRSSIGWPSRSRRTSDRRSPAIARASAPMSFPQPATTSIRASATSPTARPCTPSWSSCTPRPVTARPSSMPWASRSSSR